ncbi:hypothetical protein POH93_26210 [Phytobacter diazotrophicus]|uniref:hypothetical protein n=1 Tax=Phytobacter diazotrophicus TaxID=395631 RepID=UPI00232B3902|nr:hypothetical protein [Phytobacter diazotrophicus]MDC0728856.1 hypothetical protein [Phytobacter diazotrophicus]MDC0736095.1 hypothetical protein [Phytobacter diazotrophicus]
MAKNDFKPFATGASANVITQAEYEALTALLTGFQAGKASSAQINKAIRQATFVAAALAQYITNKTGQDVPDNGDIAAFITKMAAALGKDFQALDAALTSLAALPGTADTLAYFTGPDTLALTNLTAAGRNLINKADVASIIQYLGLQNTITQAANAVQRIGDTMSWLNVTGLIQSASMRVNTPASPSVQGLTIDWNGIGFGTAGLTNNRGLGTGGFIFRTVDAENKNEYGRVTFNEVGEIFAGRNIYAGPAKYAIDGNSYGTIWGTGGNSEWLSNNLNARFGAIPVNNTTGDVNGTAWGGSLAVNLTARFNDLQSKINAIPVDNPSGNIRGSAWGNDWLSNYLSNKFNGIQGQFSSIPVDNSSGNIHGSAWGNDWLSNWLAAQFSARDSNINTRATFDWVTANYLPRVQNYATVGTFILAYYNGGNIDPETIVSGGNLFPSTADGLGATWSLPGSWRCAGMSRTVNDAHRTTLWQRVA